jgi:uncharacterized lipoprotein YmbA
VNAGCLAPLLLAGLLAASACAHSPDPTFYALSARTGQALASPRLVIELRRPSLPPYLDHEHVIRRASAERLALDARERWSAPLEDLVGTTLANDLWARLPNCSVLTEPGAVSAPPDVQIELAFSRFELTESGNVELRATVALRWHGGNSPDLRRFEFHAAPDGGAPEAIIASMSDLLSRLSDAIATAVAQNEQPPRPPAGPTLDTPRVTQFR